MPKTVYLATILNPISDQTCQVYSPGALVVERGLIVDLGNASTLLKRYPRARQVHWEDRLLLPGFLDLHFHWVQDDVRQKPKTSLLNWLKTSVWPVEARYKNSQYSQKKAKAFFQRLRRTGTLGGLCYGSIHGHTVDHALRWAKGDFVLGNVLMTMNSPPALTQTTENAIQLVQRYSKKFRQRYAVTPRFAQSTDPLTMKSTVAIGKKHQTLIQTHLSETPGEILSTLRLYRKLPGFEKVRTYTEIYHQAGVLGPRTVVGHGIHLSAAERKLLAKTKTAVAVCPTSNAPLREQGLGSGLCDYRALERAGIHWGLASDIGGGPWISMLDVMRSFVDQNPSKKDATLVKALYRSTLGNAKIMKLGSTHGNFKKGKQANWVAFELPDATDPSPESLMSKLIRPHPRSQLQNLARAVYYRGKPIYEAQSR